MIEVCEGALPPKPERVYGRPNKYPWTDLYIELTDDGEVVAANHFFVPHASLNSMNTQAYTMEKKLNLPENTCIRCIKTEQDGVPGVQIGLVKGNRDKRQRKRI